MKKLIPLLLAIAALALGGCANTAMNHALYTTTVATGVGIGVRKYPEAIPYLRISTPIICAASEGTNVAPAEVIALLQNSPEAEAVATPEGKLILNGALMIYLAAAESYGGDVTGNETLRQYLQWTCEAIPLGLPPLPASAPTVAHAQRLKLLPPHLR